MFDEYCKEYKLYLELDIMALGVDPKYFKHTGYLGNNVFKNWQYIVVSSSTDNPRVKLGKLIASGDWIIPGDPEN